MGFSLKLVSLAVISMPLFAMAADSSQYVIETKDGVWNQDTQDLDLDPRINEMVCKTTISPGADGTYFLLEIGLPEVIANQGNSYEEDDGEGGGLQDFVEHNFEGKDFSHSPWKAEKHIVDESSGYDAMEYYEFDGQTLTLTHSIKGFLDTIFKIGISKDGQATSAERETFYFQNGVRPKKPTSRIVCGALVG